MEITQTTPVATHVVLHKGTRACVTMPEAEAVAYAEKLGKDYTAVPVEAWLGAAELNRAAPAPTKTTKAAPAPKPAPEAPSRFTTVPNGFGGTTTVKTADVPAPAPTGDAFAAAETRVAELMLNRFADRKLEVTDVTPELRAFATEWAKRWNGGDFQFMVDMRANAKRGQLSPGMAKGVLNCVRVEVQKAAKIANAVVGATAEPTKEEVPDSRYALEGADGVVTFYQVTTYKDRRYLKMLVGSVGDFIKYPIANAEKRAQIWNTLKANPAAAAKLFSRKHTVCACCAAPLSLVQSRATGFGEKCAENLGVRYISDEAEARRVCQEEGISLAGLLLEALGADGETI